MTLPICLYNNTIIKMSFSQCLGGRVGPREVTSAGCRVAGRQAWSGQLHKPAQEEPEGSDRVESRARVLVSPSACTHCTSRPLTVSAFLWNCKAKGSPGWGGSGRAEPTLKITQGTQPYPHLNNPSLGHTGEETGIASYPSHQLSHLQNLCCPPFLLAPCLPAT